MQRDKNRPWKILYVTVTLPYGPSEAFLIPEVQELRRRGCEVRIVPRTLVRGIVHEDAAEMREFARRYRSSIGRS